MQIVIAHDSEAFRAIKRAVDSPETHKISFAIRTDELVLKINEGMWTPPLSVEPCRHANLIWVRGLTRKCNACGRVFP